MTRFAFAAVALALLVFVGACGEESDELGEADQESDSTPAAEPAATGTAAEASAPEEDPRKVAAELIQARMDEDYRLVYDRLVPRAKVVQFDESGVGRMVVNAVLFTEEPPADPEDWQVEDYGKFVVARHRDLPLDALVFRQIDGEWRWDPGDHSLGRFWHATLPESARTTRRWKMPQVHRERFDFSREADTEEIRLDFPHGACLCTLAERDRGPEVTVSLTVSWLRTQEIQLVEQHLAHDTTVDLDGITWRAAGDSGSVEVVWTDATLDDGQLVLPASPRRDDEDLLPQQYSVTFRLVDFPDDAESASLEIDEMLIGPLGDDAPAYQDERYPVSVEYTFPIETTPEVLAGELPETDAPEASEAGEPIPHETLPPNPVDGAFEVTELEYHRSDDAVQADLVIDTNGVIPMQPGGEILLAWDDGYQSETQLLWQEGAIELSIERSEPPYDAEISEVTFVDLMTRRLERDENAMLYEDRIETKWGDFPILDISEANGRASVFYQSAGRRWPEFVEVEHGGRTVAIGGQSSWDRNYQLETAQLTGEPEFLDLLDEVPLPAVVQVRQLDVDATIELD